MKPYPQYKPTGIDWIGEIPEHWELKKLSHGFGRIGSGTTPSSGDQEYYLDGNINWLQTGDLTDGDIFSTSKKITPKALEDFSALKFFKPDSIVMAMYGATIGKMGILHIETTTNQACCVMAESISFIPKYAFYWFIANRAHIISLSYGGGQPNISQTIISSLRIHCPPKDEQTAIASYLDEKTAEIDKLITAKQKLIELLKEERMAVINNAVTKGINPKAKLKPSGIEWLGDIPEHWEVKKLKYISPKIAVGLVINPSSYFHPEGTVPMLTGRNISPYKIDPKTANLITEESNDELYKTKLTTGDIVVVRVGYPGVAAVVTKEIDGANCASMMIVRKGNYNSDFLCFCFNSQIGTLQVEMVQYGAAQKQFNISHAIEFIFPLPPLNEQQSIVNHINNAAQKINATISQIEKEIDLMQEYRTALISEVVTGKINVRGDISHTILANEKIAIKN